MEFQFGDWVVSPEANIVSNGDAKAQLEPRVMAVLRYLCRHPGAVIPAEEILQACWGSSELGDNPVHKAITQLRRAFGDSSTEPRYIETIRKRGYRAIAPVVTFAAPPSTVWEGGSPFRGLEAFQENHAAIFFGRVQATAQLRELVLTQAAHGCPMALILGPSGSGKTSLVRAGLLPQLMAGAIRSDEPVGLVSTVYLDCADLGSGTLFQALAGALIDADINGEPLFPGASADSLGQRLAENPEAVVVELRSRACTRAQVGVFVDRLEAVFRAQPSEADRFIGVVETLAKSNCLLILMACRNDFYPEVMAQQALLALKSRGGHFDVLPPDGADIAQMVRQPSITANLTFEKDESTGACLDDVLCDAARGSTDMLPLLQYTLNELYRQRSEDSVLKFDVYRHLGGIEGAVGVRAEQVVSRLNPGQINSLPHVLSLLVIIGDQGMVTSRRSPLAMLRSEDERELVRVMVEARLFVSELAGDVPSFGVAHEALLRRWPRVVEWIERFRGALQLRARIEGQALRWSNIQRPRDLLLPHGSQVSQAADLLTLPDFSLSPVAKEYVNASINKAKFGERLRLGIMALIAILAILSGVLGLTARNAQREAEQKRADAESLLTFMLGDFVDKLRPIGKLELLDDVAGKAMAYLAQPTGVDQRAVVQRAKALHVIFEINSKRGKRKEAQEALDAARSLLKSIEITENNDREFLRQLAVNAFLTGQGHLTTNDLVKAAKAMTEYVHYAERFSAAAPSDFDGLLELSYAHNSLGSVALKQFDYRRAADEFDRSLRLKLNVRAHRPDDRSLAVDLSNSYSWLAESRLKLGKMDDAMTLYREEEKLLRAVHEGNGAWTYRLALSLIRQSLVSQALGEVTNAQVSLEKAKNLLEKIVKLDPTNRSWAARLYNVQARQIELEEPGIDTARKVSKLSDINERLSALKSEDPKNASLGYQLAKVRQITAELLQSLNRSDEAFSMIDEAIIQLQGTKGEKSADSQFSITLGDALLTRAEIAAKSQKGGNSLADCATAANLIDQYAESNSDYTILALQVRAHLCQGHEDNVREQISTLNTIGYKDPKYLHYVSTHITKKGMQ